MPIRERAPLWSPRFDLGIRERARTWSPLFSGNGLAGDVLQGLSLAATTLPLSLLLAHLAGAPASAGIISTAVGSLVCVFLGGTRTSLAGPGLIGALVSTSIASRHGFTGLSAALVIAGVLQLVTGTLGLGRFARILPGALLRACIFGTGLALLLWHLVQTFQLLAPVVPLPVEELGDAVGASPGLLVAGAAAMLGVLSLRYRRFPGALLAVVLAVPVVELLGLSLPSVHEAATFPLPRLPQLGDHSVPSLLQAGFALWGSMTLVTLINTAALEQLDLDAGHAIRTQPDQELIGHGLATIALAFLGGLPSTQLVARSALGIRLGVTSRRPALIQALVVGLVGLAAWPFLHRVPLASLTGAAVVVAVPMLALRPLRDLHRISSLDAWQCVATIVTLVLAGLETGLFFGLAFAFAAAAIRMASAQMLLHRSRGDAAPHQVTFSGPLTFLSVLDLERVGSNLSRLEPGPGLVMDLRSVTTLDGTAAHAIVRMLDAWRAQGAKVALLGPSQKVRARLESADATARPLPPGPVAIGSLNQLVASNDRAAEALLGTSAAKLARPKLLAGLARFREEKRDHYEDLFTQLADGQTPHTLFITCADSRIDPGLLMGTHPGDLFIVRAIGALVPHAGNAQMPQEGAAIEYALGVLGVRTIVVCGHSKCGAITALRQGGIPPTLTTLQSWAEQAAPIAGDVKAHAEADEAIRSVIVRQLDNLMTYPLVRDQVQRGELQVHGWFYDLGAVELTEWCGERQCFVPIDIEPEAPPDDEALVPTG